MDFLRSLLRGKTARREPFPIHEVGTLRIGRPSITCFSGLLELIVPENHLVMIDLGLGPMPFVTGFADGHHKILVAAAAWEML